MVEDDFSLILRYQLVALGCKSTEIFLFFARHGCGALTAEDDFSSILGYRPSALNCKGTEIFFVLPNRSLVEDDFSSILGYRLYRTHICPHTHTHARRYIHVRTHFSPSHLEGSYTSVGRPGNAHTAPAYYNSIIL